MLASLALGPGIARAATINVNTLTDETTSGDNLCSLREAVNAADDNASTDCIPGESGVLDTVVLGPGTVSLDPTQPNPRLVIDSATDTGGLKIHGAGMGSTTISGAATDAPILDTANKGLLTIEDLTLSGGGGATTFLGGGILASGNSVTLTRTRLTGSQAQFGAGIEFSPDLTNFPAATLTIADSLIDSNTATPTVFPNNTVDGGAISSEGAVHIVSSTVRGNSATTTAADAYGGAIYSNGDLTVERSLIQDNTVHGKSAPGNLAAVGGGFFLQNNGKLTVVNATFTGNTVTADGGRGLGGGFGVTGTSGGKLTNATFAGNTSPEAEAMWNLVPVSMRNSIVNDGAGACIFPVTTLGGNLDAGSSCVTTNAGNGDLASTDPMLGALASNGGPTMTMALLAGSPAIDRATSCLDQQVTPQAVTVDQRSTMRPQGPACDSGAFELDYVAPVTILGSHPPHRTRKRKVSFGFSSSEAGSHFQCRIDKKAFAACSSPARYKLKIGRHRFQARAIDAVGNVDGSPISWKVRRVAS